MQRKDGERRQFGRLPGLKDQIIALYVGEKLSIRETADRLGVLHNTMKTWVAKLGIARGHSESLKRTWDRGRRDRAKQAERMSAVGRLMRGKACRWRGRALPQEWRDAISAGMTGKRTGAASPHWRGGSVKNYGTGWKRAKRLVLRRAKGRCERCGAAQSATAATFHVHHLRPFKSFTDKTKAHDPANLALLCRPCHVIAEAESRAAWQPCPPADR